MSRTNKSPAFAKVCVYVLRDAFSNLVSNLKFCLSLHFLFAQRLKVGHRWEIKGFLRYFLGIHTALYMCMTFSSPKNMLEHFKTSCGHFFCMFFLEVFWSGWPQLVSLFWAAGILNNCHWFFFFFPPTNVLEISLVLQNEFWIRSNKTTSENGAFLGRCQLRSNSSSLEMVLFAVSNPVYFPSPPPSDCWISQLQCL